MNELTVKGKQEFMGKDIPVVAGGFGKNQKCISDKTVAEIHSMGMFKVRERITANIRHFREGIDYIDLKRILVADTSEKGVHETHTLELLQSLGYAKQSITQAEHIYLLSERGYAKLIKIMDTDLAWEIHDKLIDEYFQLREEKRQKVQQERLASVNNAVKILTPMLEAAGCDSKIQLLTAKSLYEKAGVELPVMIQADQQYYDTVHIARQVGLYYKSSGKPADKAVNEIIRRLDLPDHMYTETWESKGKWQGTVRKYSSQVIDMVAQWIVENDYPRNIEYIQCDGQRKSYHVIWRKE